MPVGFGDNIEEEWKPLDGELSEGAEHSITITPDSESYVVYVVDGEQNFGEKGTPVTVSRTVRKVTGGFSFIVGAEVVSNLEEVPPPAENLATLRVAIKNVNIS